MYRRKATQEELEASVQYRIAYTLFAVEYEIIHGQELTDEKAREAWSNLDDEEQEYFNDIASTTLIEMRRTRDAS